MIVVLDTNVLISGIFFRGPPATILEAWLEGRFEAYATPKILEEYIRVLEEISKLRVPHFEHSWEEILAERCRLVPDVEMHKVALIGRVGCEARQIDSTGEGNRASSIEGKIRGRQQEGGF